MEDATITHNEVACEMKLFCTYFLPVYSCRLRRKLSWHGIFPWRYTSSEEKKGKLPSYWLNSSTCNRVIRTTNPYKNNRKEHWPITAKNVRQNRYSWQSRHSVYTLQSWALITVFLFSLSSWQYLYWTPLDLDWQKWELVAPIKDCDNDRNTENICCCDFIDLNYFSFLIPFL